MKVIHQTQFCPNFFKYPQIHIREDTKCCCMSPFASLWPSLKAMSHTGVRPWIWLQYNSGLNQTCESTSNSFWAPEQKKPQSWSHNKSAEKTNTNTVSCISYWPAWSSWVFAVPHWRKREDPLICMTTGGSPCLLSSQTISAEPLCGLEFSDIEKQRHHTHKNNRYSMVC